MIRQSTAPLPFAVQPSRSLAPVLLALTILTGGAEAQVGKRTGMLDPNLASEAELRALPGMNVALAKRVIESRPLLRATQLDSVLAPALTPEQRSTLYARLFLPINLNRATRNEILLVPGVGRRMAHEFEEYRPYRNLGQFRREIGKYVDRKELARLESYVTLRKPGAPTRVDPRPERRGIH